VLQVWIARKAEQFTPELKWLWQARGDPLTQWFRAASVVGRMHRRTLPLIFWLPFTRGKRLGVRLLRGRFHRGVSVWFHCGQVAQEFAAASGDELPLR
jgi:hypothetical protein